MADFRKLCAELLFCLDDFYPLADGEGWPVSKAWAAMERARAALAGPQIITRDRDETGPYIVVAMPQPPADDDVVGLVARLRQLVRAVAEQRWGEFSMRVPAEPSRDADLVLTRAADLLERLADGPAVQSREPASVTTKPSDQQLLELMPETMRDEFSYAARTCSNAMAGRVKPGIFRVALNAAALEYARAVLARWGTPNLAETRSSIEPIPVSERLPEANTKVLAHYFNALGKGRTICAIWVPAKSRSEDCDFSGDDFTEYDEEDDKFYWPEGWYEAIENWDELGWVKVNEGEITYWQPLPKWPAPALPLPSGGVE